MNKYQYDEDYCNREFLSFNDYEEEEAYARAIKHGYA